MKEWDGDPTDSADVRDVHAEDCVIWCDWGRALEIGAETCADNIDNIVFRNCDIVRTAHVAMDIQHGDRARITNILFEGIRVEMDRHCLEPVYQSKENEMYSEASGDYCPQLFFAGIGKNSWSHDNKIGSIENVTFKNITVTSSKLPESVLCGADEEHKISNVAFDNIVINGKRTLSAEDANLKIMDYVEGVSIS